MFRVHTALDAHILGIFQCELIVQEIHQVLGPAMVGAFAGIHLASDIVCKELHLAPEVVVEAPADEILDALLPLLSVGYVEYTRLQIGYHVGAEREVLVHPVLRQSRELGALGNQPLGQAACTPRPRWPPSDA